MKNVTKISARLVVALLVSACSGAPVAPATSTGAAAHRKTPNGGGAFTAETSGNYTFSDCSASANGHLKFRGSGRASYLHRVNESGAVKGKNYPPHCVWSGTATLTSRHHKMNSVTFSLGLNGSRYSNPCNNALGYVVKRGTGKFAKASGYGTVAFSCTDSGYLATWSGTLTY
jgi:hypothetical protein